MRLWPKNTDRRTGHTSLIITHQNQKSPISIDTKKQKKLDKREKKERKQEHFTFE